MQGVPLQDIYEVSSKTRLYCAIAALLVGFYHVENAAAGHFPASSGNVADEIVNIKWEYDLNGVSVITIFPDHTALGLFQGNRLYLGGLIPPGATNVVFSTEGESTIETCSNNPPDLFFNARKIG